MNEVRYAGRSHQDVNHLKGDIWQMEVDGSRVTYRLLFAKEGRSGEVLLALEVVNKKWESAKSRHIALAARCLAEWRERGLKGVEASGTCRPRSEPFWTYRSRYSIIASCQSGTTLTPSLLGGQLRTQCSRT
jgi:hypothetical protein